MEMHTRKVLVIITEALLEKQLVADIERLGAHGHTITQAYGEGSRGKRNADLEGTQNIKVEIVCDENLSHELVKYLSEHYMPNYAMILYVLNAEVIRPEKF